MPRINAVLTCLTIVFLLSMVIPETFTDSYHFAGIPLGAFILAFFFLVLLVRLLGKRDAVSPAMLGGLAALMITMVWGYLRGNIETYSMKFFAADTFCFVALLAGHALARTQSTEYIDRLAVRAALIVSFAIMATYIGLVLGVVTTTYDIVGRIVTASIFNAGGVMIILLPWATVSATRSDAFGGWRTVFLFAAAAGTCLLSATRSFAVALVAAACLYLIIKRKRFGTVFLLRLAASVGILILLAFATLPGQSAYVLSRLNGTNLADEDRYEEVKVLWPQIKDDFVAGQGMGSLFVSNVVVNGNSLTPAPHIGILTFLIKGGVLLFLGYAVLPSYVAAYVLFSPKFGETQRGAAASALVFILLSSLSGGWNPLSLFAYGLALGSMTSGRLRPSVSVDYHPGCAGETKWPGALRPPLLPRV